MRGRKHPLEVYQRASPFTGWEEDQGGTKQASPWWGSRWWKGLSRRGKPGEGGKAPRRSPAESAGRSSGSGDRAAPSGGRVPQAPPAPRPDSGGGWYIRGVPWHRFLRNKAAGARRRVRRIPLQKAAWAASPLVLALLVFYAVRFWPVGGEEGSQDPSTLRNEWRAPPSGQQDQGAEPAPRFYIQLKSGSIMPASDDPQVQARHDNQVRAWLEEKARLDAVLQRKLAEGGLGDLGLVVDAWHSDMKVQNDVRLVIGGWEQRDDKVLDLYAWLKENGFEDALIIEF